MQSREEYFFIRLDAETYLAFEVVQRASGWYWYLRPHFSPPGEEVGPFETSVEAYQSAMRSQRSQGRSALARRNSNGTAL